MTHLRIIILVFLLHSFYAKAQKTYTKAALLQDVHYLTSTMERVHPNLYHSIAKKQYRLLTDSIQSLLQDSMTEKQAWPLLARLVGAIGEGHSVMDFPEWIYDSLKNGQTHLVPFLVHHYEKGYFVVKADLSAANKMQPGDRILAINGIPVNKLVDILSAYAGGLRSFRAIDICNNLSVCFYLYGMPGPYRLQYLRHGEHAATTVTNLSYQDFVALRALRTKQLVQNNETPHFFFTHNDKRYACVAINTLTDSLAVLKRFLDSCFAIIKTAQPAKLIIDLRKNGGGNSALGELLLSYITDKPFRMTGGERWKVSTEYKKQLLEQNQGAALAALDQQYVNAANGTVMTIDADPVQKPPFNPLLYREKVEVLIGPNTFSSANMLANVIQDFHLATLVGEPTGEPANDYGELIYLQLPNTGFHFTTSTKQFIRANGHASDRRPVSPVTLFAGDYCPSCSPE